MNLSLEIKPIVKNISVNEKKLVLGKLGDANFTIKFNNLVGELSNNALLELYKGLDSLMSINSKEANGKIEIFLEISNKIPAEITKNENQGYKIEIGAKK